MIMITISTTRTRTTTPPAAAPAIVSAIKIDKLMSWF